MAKKDFVVVNGVNIPMRNITEIRLIEKDGELCRKITHWIDGVGYGEQYVSMAEGYEIEKKVRKFMIKR